MGEEGIFEGEKGGLTVRFSMLPSTNLLVFGSIPIDPEQYTTPPDLMACEKKGIGAGALSVRTACFDMSACGDLT